MKKPIVIAGPCSLESRQQLAATVDGLASCTDVSMIRCGVWKPRTQPGGFEGVGDIGLRWIEKQKLRHPSLRFCCEVANPHHVEQALLHGLDALWIGARTTASPFAVQEVTEALRGTGVPVMIKNAPMPDIHIWLGAIERCRQVGVTHISAVHRGFDIYNNQGYRNNPLWEIPMELHRLLPDMPLLCDPSHISGRSEWVGQVSQTALDLHFDGLMIEVHPQPSEALTDARQQLTPDGLARLLSELVVRSGEPRPLDNLEVLRRSIDDIDRQLLSLLAERQKASLEIAGIKKSDNLTVFQPDRWNALLTDRLDQAESLGLDTAYTKEIFETIHAESVRKQEEAMNKPDPIVPGDV